MATFIFKTASGITKLNISYFIKFSYIFIYLIPYISCFAVDGSTY